jgi:hypothetical protein
MVLLELEVRQLEADLVKEEVEQGLFVVVMVMVQEH